LVLALAAMAIAGCGNGSSDQDVLDDVTVLDAAGDTGDSDVEGACRNFHPQKASVGRVWPGADGVSKSVI